MAALRIIISYYPNSFKSGSYYFYSTASQRFEYLKCCKILGVTVNSDQEEIRIAYLKLVKKYHPDRGGDKANGDKFAEIDKAFKTLISNKSKERCGVSDADSANMEEPDISHTVPQHRQYLSYGGIGSGTPFEREKQYSKFRAFQASENVFKHRIAKVASEKGALLVKTEPLNHKIKTKYGFDRLVEDLIQESMSKGEFSNLSGIGKPLKRYDTRNPYVDFVTHKMNEVLIDNGFTPEWITLQKEIREEIQLLRDRLLSERSYFGPHPLEDEENSEWTIVCSKYEKFVEDINKKIDKFNLVVPILNKQMIQINLRTEGKKVLIKGRNCEEIDDTKPRRNFEDSPQDVTQSPSENVFRFFENLFKDK